MSKCKKCGISIGYLKYYCSKCRKIILGKKPTKTKNLCIGCINNWYNQNRDNGCYGYKNAKIITKYIYYSLNQIIPNLKWKLNCFTKAYYLKKG